MSNEIEEVISAHEVRIIFLNVDPDTLEKVGNYLDEAICSYEEYHDAPLPFVRLDVVDVTDQIVIADEDLINELEGPDSL